MVKNWIISFQLGKYFATQLHAKDDLLRDEAVFAVAALSKQVTTFENLFFLVHL